MMRTQMNNVSFSVSTSTAAVKAANASSNVAKLAAVLAAATLTLALALFGQVAGANQAFADEGTGYNYKIVLYAGDGTIDGKTEVVQELAPGATYTLPVELAVPSDSRYYVKGVREAGHDDLISNLTVTANEDKQYVVAYGLKKETVNYTINYVDANGNKLMDSQIFTGNVGDKPVVAYHYIEGYQPNAYNITGTLKADKINEFNFVYTRVARSANAGATDQAADATGGTEGEATEPADEEAGQVENQDNTDETVAAAEPVEIIDIDEDANPLANAQTALDEGTSGPLDYLPWVFGVVATLAIISLIVLSAMKRRVRRDQ